MAHSNVSIFVPHVGCPHMCSFCNQHSISGTVSLPRGEDVKRCCEKALMEVKNREDTEIAFFGGSFTAIERSYMRELLDATRDFVGEGLFKGIRVSTRPDAIDDEVLMLLKSYGVTTVELGVQSMFDDVLEKNDRGHTALDVVKASSLIKSYGFNLGLQMMVGLYKSTPEKDIETAKRIAELSPSEVRIYPVVILENTRLGELFKTGDYVPYTLDTAIDICKELMLYFEKKNIRVIKLGLHASEIVENTLLGGLYHPAFRELCESRIYRDLIEKECDGCKSIEITVHNKNVSKAIGQRRENIEYFKDKGISLKVIGKPEKECYNLNIIDVKKG